MSEQEQVNLDNPISTRVESAGVPDKGVKSAGPPRLALVLSVLALLTVAIGLFMGYRYWHGMKLSLQQLNSSLLQANREQAAMRERLALTSQTIEQQRQAIAEQETRLREQRREWEQEREALQQQEDRLNHSLARIHQRFGGEVDLWQVAEAEFLMRLANQRLNLMGDPATALAALRAADERLQELADPGWKPTRESLVREIAALEAVPEVDHEGLNTELSELLGRLEALPSREQGVPLAARTPPLHQAANEPPQQDLGLKQIWRDLWQGFKSMMVIRHHDQPVSAMLPPQQRYFLVQNLRLKLEAAKAALMGRNQDLYRDSLTSAAQWVERYFASESPQAAGFLEQLQTLAAHEIAPQLPDISASLRTLQVRREAMTEEASAP